MGDDEPATLDGQFYEFAKLFETKQERRDGLTITLYRNDYWFRQAKILEDRKLTMTDTGVTWWKYCKTELNWDEWYVFLTDLCTLKGFNQEDIEFTLTNCGIPGTTPVYVPQYRDFFDTFKPKVKTLF